jgi:hypothetical protein
MVTEDLRLSHLISVTVRPSKDADITTITSERGACACGISTAGSKASISVRAIT